MASTRTAGPAAPAAASARAPRRGLLRGRSPRPPRSGPGRLTQIKNVYDMTARVDPAVKWWLLLALLGPLVVMLVIGLAIGHPVYLGFIGLLLGVLAALITLTRRAERAAYSQIEGTPGAAGQALKTLRRGWTVTDEPVAMDPRTRDLVFRAVGRPGVVLVSDGPVPRVNRLLESERRRVARVLPDVPVHLVRSGRGDDLTPIGKLPRRVMRLKPSLTRAEVAAVNKRLKALGGMKMPVPKGIDPMRARPDRKGARGR